ncbi:RcnB family protein [Acinetobacter defluvii]|uniref:RcnB family protein n=1 Tax=Acinetobacter defluvii TaxID=1871111 RepID=UPI003AF4C63E
MKKMLTALAISFSVLATTTTMTHAGPHRDGYEQRGQGHKKGFRDFQQDEDQIREQRREREERGVRRLQQHKWQTGYVMPQHYRGNSYKVDYKDNNLPKPSRNQQWYKVNNDYILVDSENNNIVGIRGM